MNTKSKFLVYSLIVVMLVLQIVPVAAQGETPPQPMDVMISDRPSSEDANWPIIKHETRKRKDPSTGMDIVETIVVRQQSAKDNKDCDKNKASKFVVGATLGCQFSISISKSSTVYVGGGAVTSFVKAFADKYCNTWNGECNYVYMKKVEVYWTRTSTSFGVINARTYMGCSNPYCLLCTNGIVTTNYMDRSSYFNPSWNGLKTYTYTRTAAATMPIMMAFLENNGYPIAGNDSTATAPRTAYSISNYVVFVFP